MESKSERPSLRVIKGKRRRFEPPEGVVKGVVEESGKRFSEAMRSNVLDQPVNQGTRKTPSFEEHARAKDLENELDANNSEAKSPENH